MSGSRARHPLRIAFFGSSFVSACWNDAATYYRGIIRALHERGHRITFYEPDAYQREQRRDIVDPPWARVVVYQQTEAEILRQLEAAATADVIVKASGVGAHDALLERAVLELASPGAAVIFWDVDVPATLASVEGDLHSPMRNLIPRYHAVFTYGGGDPIVRRYRALGARACIPICNAVDPETHHRARPDPRFDCDLALCANRLPDGEASVEEFFLTPARALPRRTFIIGGSGWADRELPPNVHNAGHISTADHNAFNSTPLAVLNISRDSMAQAGWSPATRVLEAAGAGACLITDAWDGLEEFLEPGREVLVARDGAEVAQHLERLDRPAATRIGAAALARVQAEHTYRQRAAQVEEALRRLGGPPHRPADIHHTVSSSPAGARA